jgi:hypothetical protein
MMVDPDFDFRMDLPNVSNVHRARVVIDCSRGPKQADAPYEITIEDTGQVVTLARTNGIADDAYLDVLPAAIRVEQLAERRVVEDHTAYVTSVLEQHRRQAQEEEEQRAEMRESRRRAASCGCSASVPASAGWIPALIGCVLLLSARRAARRRR